MAVTTNLYPPIIDTFMPAFLITDVETYPVTKTYTVTSYVDQTAYDSAVDQYIINSPIDGVEELWAEYEQKLADLRAGGITPEEIEAERLLKIEYHNKLVELISGSATEDQIENIFFAERPEPQQIEKTATFDTANTTKNKFICRVYFALSMFNSLSEIQNAQITVRSQLTNKSVLHPSKYPCEIMLQKIKTDLTRQTEDKYYIEIRPEDLINCNFVVDQYYKIQIRFTSVDAEDPGINLDDKDAVQAIDDWLSRNLKYFSEWSSVCLIRGISVPTLTIQDFGEGSATEIYDTIANVQVIGQLTFADSNETETLKSVRIKAYDNSDKLLTDSGDILLNDFTDINHFNYAIKYYFSANNIYYFTVEYTTSNLYTELHSYPFSVIQAETPDLNIQVTAYKDEDNGRLGIRIQRARSKGRYTGQLIIRRACHKDNFTVWEDLYTTNYDHVSYIDFTWYDNTIESGVWYLYGIQGVDTNGARTPMTLFKEPVMLNLEDMFLTSGDRQLKISFNPSISSFKHTLSEARVETIGSKYPFIKRNGVVNYVQFPISGLITTFMDEDNTFYSKDEAYGDYASLYSDYNDDKSVSMYSDFIWEKAFRDKVQEFLYNDDVKLFRSPTEGNYLVKIMDVQFTPNQSLGRMLWSFSGTAYEVDECTLENFDKYGIVSLTDGNTISSGGEDEPSTLTPIRRIVYVTDEFPTKGQLNVLYVYNKQLYLWNEDEQEYYLISVPLWNEDLPDLSNENEGVANQLYTDSENNLYLWNTINDEYDLISVPEVLEG